MDATARWFKALIRSRKSKAAAAGEDTLRGSALSKSKRWILWKPGVSGKGKKEHSLYGSVRFSQIKYLHGDIMDLEARTWAAIRIQCAFRRLLARRALRALRAIVRVQAIVRGCLVRRQIAESRKILQSTHLCETKKQEWCDRQGSVQEIEARQQYKHDAAIRRERALVYALSLQAGVKRPTSEFSQLWQRQLTGLDKSPAELQRMPEVAKAYYYSGPILTPLATPSPSSSLVSCVRKDTGLSHLHNFKDCCSLRRLGYMEATISMRAKCKSNKGHGNMQDPCLRYENDCNHYEQQQQHSHHPHTGKPLSRRVHSTVTGQLDMQHFLVECG